MTQYIDKAAVVAEIEDKIKKYTLRGEESDFLQDGNAKYWGGVLSCLNEIHSYLNTLEVKEVNLEKEYKDFIEEDPVYNKLVNGIVGKAIAKHFFELGLKAQKGE